MLCTIANYWKVNGHEVSILTFEKRNNESSKGLNADVNYEGLGISTAALPIFKKIFLGLRIPFVLRKGILETNPEVVISFMDQANMFTLLSLIGTGVPVVVSERANPENSSIMDKKWPKVLRKVFSILRNILYRRATYLIAQTKGQANYFPKGIQKKTIIIPNPLSPKQEAVADIKLPQSFILGMGRLTWEKRFDLLIDAFSAVARKHPDWSLVIVGEGKLRVELVGKIKSLGLESRISLPGATTTPYGVFEQAEIFVLSSESEGYPSVLMEAMSVGLAVISTDCSFGPSEIVQHGIDGILVATKDTQALSNAISYLIENPLKRKELGAAALENSKRFELLRVMKEWEVVLKSSKNWDSKRRAVEKKRGL